MQSKKKGFYARMKDGTEGFAVMILDGKEYTEDQLRSALSPSDPVAFTSQGQIAAARSGSTAILYGKRDEFMNVPLYAAPPAPSVAVENLITEVHDAIDEYREGMKGDKFGPHEWPTVDGIKTTVAQSLRRSALSAQVQDVATHRHKKRGTQYVLIGVGKMQVENWCEFTTEVNHTEGREYAFAGKAVDMREVAIYRSVDDGSLWVRPIEEFNDGRFEPLPAAPAKQEGQP